MNDMSSQKMNVEKIDFLGRCKENSPFKIIRYCSLLKKALRINLCRAIIMQ